MSSLCSAPRPVRILLLASLLGLAPAALSAAGEMAGSGAALRASIGRSADDLRAEQFLSSAEVVADKPLGEGTTGARCLTLRQGDYEGRALFKTVDVEVNELVRTDRLESGFRDSYLFEVAAYRLDRALGLGLVPVTVVREVNGVRGSLQQWVDGVTSVRKAPAGATGNFDLLHQRLMEMYLLDELIANVDRNPDNILVDPASDRFVLVDHSRSFRINRRVSPPQRVRPAPLPEQVTSHLLDLDREGLASLVGDLVSPTQIRSLLARRDHLVKLLRPLGVLRG